MPSTLAASLFDNQDALAWILLAGVASLAIVGHTVRSVVSSLARERSRREIAAYIAEGSMSAEQGDRLMSASRPERGAR